MNVLELIWEVQGEGKGRNYGLLREMATEIQSYLLLTVTSDLPVR